MGFFLAKEAFARQTSRPTRIAHRFAKVASSEMTECGHLILFLEVDTRTDRCFKT